MYKKFIIVFLSSVLSTKLFAQAETAVSQSSNVETLLYVIIGLVLLISLLVLLVAAYTLTVVRTILGKEKAKAEEGEGVEEETFWIKVSKSLTKAKPVEEEEDILLDHNYDGIKELDNHLPPWWKYLFYITIVWALIYLLVYHVFDMLPLSADEYNRSIVKAEAAMEARKASSPSMAIDENNVTVSTDPSDLANGKTIFNRQCAVCHQEDGGGNVGPNMTDNYWIHGGSMKDIFLTIKYGVPQMGMISWESQLNPTEMRNVSSYIKEILVGSTPANPKEPQGELYDPSIEEKEQVESDTIPDIVSMNAAYGGSLSN